MGQRDTNRLDISEIYGDTVDKESKLLNDHHWRSIMMNALTEKYTGKDVRDLDIKSEIEPILRRYQQAYIEIEGLLPGSGKWNVTIAAVIFAMDQNLGNSFIEYFRSFQQSQENA